MFKLSKLLFLPLIFIASLAYSQSGGPISGGSNGGTGPTGPTGPAGASGAAGPTGATGAGAVLNAGTASYQIVQVGDATHAVAITTAGWSASTLNLGITPVSVSTSALMVGGGGVSVAAGSVLQTPTLTFMDGTSMTTAASGETNTYASTKTFTSDVAIGGTGISDTAKVHISSGSTTSLLIDGSTAVRAFQIGTSSFVVAGGGNVGIGVAAASQKLHIQDANQLELEIESTGAKGEAFFLKNNNYTSTIGLEQPGTTGFIFGQASFLAGGAGYTTAAPSLQFANNSGDISVSMVGANTGFGSNHPAAKVHVSSGALLMDGNLGVTSYVIQVSSINGSTTTFSVMGSGHVDMGGTSLPVLSSCGTSPSLTPGSNDSRGQLTTGSATGTGCTITFGTPYATGVFCFVFDMTGGLTSPSWSQTKTALTLTSLVNSDSYGYICYGQ